MPRPHPWTGSLLGVLLFTSAGPARADIDAQTRAAAERLFDEGLALLAAGDTKEACAKLEKAVELTERKAAGGLIQLGRCWEKLGRTASAWATLREAESLAATLGQADREREATTAAAALVGKLAQVRIRLAAPAPGARVTRDGALLPEVLRSEPLPVDPGHHVIEVSAPGHFPHRVEIDVPAGPTVVEVAIPALVPAPPPLTGPESRPPGSLSRRPAAKEDGSPWSTIRILGIGVAGAGALAMGASLGVILSAKSAYDEALEGCDTLPATPRCSPGPRRAVESARGQGDVGTGLFVAGAAAFTAGGVLAIVAPSSRPGEPSDAGSVSLRLGVGSASVEGTW